MKTIVIRVLLAFGIATVAIGPAQLAAQANEDSVATMGGDTRSWLKERGILLMPRVSLFYQGLSAGEGDHGPEFGGKADLLLDSDLGKVGLWDGLSLTIHAEYNFGKSANGRGGLLSVVNTALYLPGMEGADAFDLSSVYVTQRFGDSASLLLGKMNMIDIAARRPFMGGAGVDAFWNIVFVAPPSGTIPPYLFGALLGVRTEAANYGLWVYDPISTVNKPGFEDAFSNGVTLRGSVEFPVSIGGRRGHQGFVALYSTQTGTDLESLGGLFLPGLPPGTVGIKDRRYYFAYSFDQVLYQSPANSREGVGMFGQFAISDGNPNRLYRSALIGIGGTGLIAGRSGDNWGVGYYDYTPSPHVKDALAPVLTVRNEQGLEIFYNFAMLPWLAIGVDLQVIRPGLSSDRAVFAGLRTVIRF